MIKNGVGYVEESLGQRHLTECAAPRAVAPKGKGVLQDSNAAGIQDSWAPEAAAAPVANSYEKGLQKPGGSK